MPNRAECGLQPCGVGTQNSFEARSDPLESGAGPLIANVGVKADTHDLPDLQGVPQHQQLGFRIGGCADRPPGQPRVADLTSIRNASPVQGMCRRPCPSLQVPEAGGTNDAVVLCTDDKQKGTALPASRQASAVSTYLAVSSSPCGTGLQR